MSSKSIGKNIKNLLQVRVIPLERLVPFADLSLNRVMRIESRTNKKNPTIETITEIAKP